VTAVQKLACARAGKAWGGAREHGRNGCLLSPGDSMRPAGEARPRTVARRPATAAPGGQPAVAAPVPARSSPVRRRAPARGPPAARFFSIRRLSAWPMWCGRVESRPQQAFLPPSLALGARKPPRVALRRHHTQGGARPRPVDANARVSTGLSAPPLRPCVLVRRSVSRSAVPVAFAAQLCGSRVRRRTPVGSPIAPASPNAPPTTARGTSPSWPQRGIGPATAGWEAPGRTPAGRRARLCGLPQTHMCENPGTGRELRWAGEPIATANLWTLAQRLCLGGGAPR